MASLTNPGLRPVPLPTGHVVPRAGTLVTTNDVLRCPDNAAMLRGLILSGALTVDYDPEPDADADAVKPAAATQPDPVPTPEVPEKGKKGA